jgi:hypothetical protein
MDLPDERIIAIKPLQSRLTVITDDVKTIQAKSEASAECLQYRLFGRPQFEEHGATHVRWDGIQGREFVLAEIVFGNIHCARAITPTLDVDAGRELPSNGN